MPVTRRVAVGLVLSAVALLTGCAQVRSFTTKEWPSLGSKEATALREESTPGRPSKGDLYAKTVGKGEALSNSEIASRQRKNRADAVADSRDRPEIDRVSTGQVDLDLPPRSRANNSMVTLQAPEPLPPLPDAESLAKAANEEPPGGLVEEKGWTGTSNSPVRDAPRVEPETIQPESDATAVADPPVVEPAAAPSVEEILAQSRKTLDGVATYQVKMNYQERVNGNLKPVEDAVLSIRREPLAVRIEWPDGSSKGREVLYLSDAQGGMMHVHMANSLVPTLTMAPDSPLAMRSSRHPISEAGLDTILTKLEAAVHAEEVGDRSFGKLTYEGIETPKTIGRPSYKILRVTPTGERWVVDIDTETKLPCMVQANAPNGDLLERYVFLDPKLDEPELKKATAFNPDTRWGAPKGLFSRLARAAANPPSTETH